MMSRDAWMFSPSVHASRLLALLVALALSLGCDKTKEPTPAPGPPQPAALTSPPPVALSNKLSRPAALRVVAIGDLHGDADHMRRALKLAGAIDANDTWIGGKLTVVQTGDQIDRGDDDKTILDLIEALKKQATTAGGEVIALDGNHEIMNAEHDFRYVTAGAMKAFGDREKAFAPGGPYAGVVAQHPIFMKVGDDVFVHGGILPKHVTYGLDRMNDELDDWLAGKRATAPSVVTSPDGPIWTRAYSAEGESPDCASAKEVLGRLAAKRMIVGHTVQKRGINSACDGTLWRIDVGLSRFYGGPIEALELSEGGAKVLREREASSSSR